MAAAPPPPRELIRLAERDLIRDRFRSFALVWSACSVPWLVALGGARTATVLVAAAQTALLTAAAATVRRSATLDVTRVTAVAASAGLGIAWAAAAALAAERPFAIVAAFLPMLACLPPLFFAWSSRAQCVPTLAAIATALAALQLRGSDAGTAVAVAAVGLGALGVGIVVAVGVSREMHARLLRRQAEEQTLGALAESRDAQRASEERFRVAFDQAPIGMAMVGVDGTILQTNSAFERLLGQTAAEIVGTHIDGIVYPDDIDAARAHRRNFLQGDAATEELVFRLRHRDDHAVWIRLTRSLVHDRDGKPSYMIGQVEDVTERRRAEEALRASMEKLRRREEQLRLLAQRQVRVREEERRRLGFDLHDDVCQELVGTGILVESVRCRLDAADAESRAKLERVGRHLNALAEHLRQLARELRPMLLLDLGLEDSLRSLAGGMSTAATRVVATFPTAIPRLDAEVEVAVYRVAQEAITNALRHAAAQEVAVSLAIADRVLRLEVHDDGCGFDPEVRRREALGLISMEERALALDGRLELTSERGGGTVVRLVCPARHVQPRTAA